VTGTRPPCTRPPSVPRWALAALCLVACTAPPPSGTGTEPAAAEPAAAPEPAPVDAPPADALVVAVTGEDFRWHYRYPGDDGQLGTGDDVRATGDLHLPAHRRIFLRLTSEDYLYTFSLPELSKTEAAIPDLEMTLELATGAPGTFELRGDQFCGYSHEGLMGKMIVQEAEELRAWMQRANETEQTS